MEDHKQIKAAFLGKKCSLAQKSYAGTFRILFGERFAKKHSVKDEVKSFDYAEISLHSNLGHWVLMSANGDIVAGSDGQGVNMEALSQLEYHAVLGMYFKKGYISLVFDDSSFLLLRPYDDNKDDEEVAIVFQKDQAACKLLTSGAVVNLNSIER